jgi:hypothetical protein
VQRASLRDMAMLQAGGDRCVFAAADICMCRLSVELQQQKTHDIYFY